MQSFKDLVVWQKSVEFTENIYRQFSRVNDFGFKSQIQRASLSISNNIAEGYARRSDNAFRSYLNIARASAVEVESMLIIANRLGYLDQNSQTKLTDSVIELEKMIYGLLRKL